MSLSLASRRAFMLPQSRSRFVGAMAKSNSSNNSRAGMVRLISTGQPKKVGVQSIVEADTGAVGTKYYHMANTALLVAAPLALFISPSPFVMPLDLFLGVAFPLHAHIGFNYIISDYVPKASRPLARYALLGVTGITILGLLKLNITGPGLTETYKALWREKADEKKE